MVDCSLTDAQKLNSIFLETHIAISAKEIVYEPTVSDDDTGSRKRLAREFVPQADNEDINYPRLLRVDPDSDGSVALVLQVKIAKNSSASVEIAAPTNVNGNSWSADPYESGPGECGVNVESIEKLIRRRSDASAAAL